MRIPENLVRELQKKTDISYEQAEFYLKRARGNVALALELIASKRNSRSERFKSGLHELFVNLMQYRFIILRKGEVMVNLPLLLLLLLIMMMGGFYSNISLFIVILVVILVTECEVKIKKKGEQEAPPSPREIRQPVASNRPRTEAEPLNTSRETGKTVPTAEGEGIKKTTRTQEASKSEDDFYEIVIED